VRLLLPIDGPSRLHDSDRAHRAVPELAEDGNTEQGHHRHILVEQLLPRVAFWWVGKIVKIAAEHAMVDGLHQVGGRRRRI
jgi:hypothetical protein